MFVGYAPQRYWFNNWSLMPSRMHCSVGLHCHLSKIRNISGKALRKSGFEVCFWSDTNVCIRHTHIVKTSWELSLFECHGQELIAVSTVFKMLLHLIWSGSPLKYFNRSWFVKFSLSESDRRSINDSLCSKSSFNCWLSSQWTRNKIRQDRA